MPIAKKNGFAAGLAPYTDCARLYPHRLKGEGHFLALLQKKGNGGEQGCSLGKRRMDKGNGCLWGFCKGGFAGEAEGNL